MVALVVAVVAFAADGPSVYRTWRTFTTDDGLPDASIRVIRVVDGDVWVGTDAGLARRNDDGWSSWTAADGLPEAPVSAIEIDPRTGDLWLGTWGGGLLRFTGGRFDRFTQFNSGLAGDLIFDLAVADGRVWTAGNGGVNAFDPVTGTWDLYLETRADTALPAVTALLSTGDHLYAGAWCGPLLRHDAERGEWLPIGAAPVVAAGEPRITLAGGETEIALAAGGSALWWTSRGRLFRREKGDPWPGLSLARPDAAAGFVTSLAARSDRELWIGSSAGLTVVRAGQVVESHEVEAALPDPRVRCLAFEGDDLWVGTPRGLALGTDRTPWKPSKLSAEGAESVVSPAAAGPGRWKGEARIGVLGPFTRPVSLPGASSPWPTPPVDRGAVARAVERANDRRTRPDRVFALVDNVVSFMRYGWVTAQDSFAMLRDEYHAHGLVGYIGPDAFMDNAVASRTEVPVVNIAPTDPTLDESLNPWVFRCGENDPRLQLRLLDFVFDSLGRSRPALLRTPGEETEARLERWSRHSAARGHAPVAELEWKPGDAELPARIEELRRSRADVVLTWADARQTAALVRELRAAGLTHLVVGSDRVIGSEFVELAGPEPGSVIALSRCPHLDLAGDAAARDEEAMRRRPDIARKPALPQAGRSLDAAAHLAVAIELAGTEREAIRRMLDAMSRLRVARLEDGAWVVEEPGSP